MKKELQRKICKFEIKASEDIKNDPDYIGTFEGLASTFGNVDEGGDIILKGAFSKVIAVAKQTGSMPKSLIQHNLKTGAVIDDIFETDIGLFVKGRFINTQNGRDLQIEVRTGAIDSFSIGYIVEECTYSENGDNRIISLFDELWEISFVTFPMNRLAKITGVKSVRDFENLLTNNGFSNKDAKIIIANGYKSLNRDDCVSDQKNHRDDEIFDVLKNFTDELKNQTGR